MISYSHASIYSSRPEDYVLLVHGRNHYDAYIQLGDFITMESWQACLNQDIMKQQQQQQQHILTMSAVSQPPPIKTSVEDEDDTVSIIGKGPLRRRRSKSDPTSLLALRIHGEQLKEYPLLASSLSIASTQSNNSESSSTSSFRKRRKTYNGL
jgi:hypothetical protein